MAYATVDELRDHLGGHEPPQAQLLLDRASRDIDRALISTVYDPDDSDVQAALRLATLEQVAAGLNAERRAVSFALGRLSVQRPSGSNQPRRIGDLWAEAWTVLQAAGLTGHAPITW